MAGTVVIDTLKSSTTGPVVFQNTSGTEVGQLCRAWVNFNGTTSPGTIRASFNVSSVTKNGTGDYTINFTTSLADANYSAVCSGDANNAMNIWYYLRAVAFTTTTCRLYCSNTSGIAADDSIACVSVFR